MRRRWLAYLLTAIAACGIGVAIAGLPGGLPGNASVELETGSAATTTTATTTTAATTPPTASPTTSPTTSEPTQTSQVTPSTAEPPSTTQPPDTTLAATTTSTSTSPATTVEPVDETEEPQDPTDLAVAVANGAGIPGLAGDAAGTLRDAGLSDVSSVNTGLTDVTSIYASIDDREIAELIAFELSILPTAIAERSAAPSVEGAGPYAIIVVLGADREP